MSLTRHFRSLFGASEKVTKKDFSKGVEVEALIFAQLPVELIRLILKFSADGDRTMARSLCTVSRSIQTLVTASFYHTVILRDINAVNSFAKAMRSCTDISLHIRNIWIGDENLRLPDLPILHRAFVGDSVAALELFTQLTVSVANILRSSTLVSLAIDCRLLYLISNPGWVWHQGMDLRELVLSASHYFPPPYPCPHSVTRICLVDSILMAPVDVNIFSQYENLEIVEFYSYSMSLRKWANKMLPKALASQTLRSVIINAPSTPLVPVPADPRIIRRRLPFLKGRRDGVALQEWERRTNSS